MVIGGAVLLLLAVGFWFLLRGTVRLLVLALIALLVISLPFLGVH